VSEVCWINDSRSTTNAERRPFSFDSWMRCEARTVLPEPVGAQISTLRAPARSASRACSIASV
jgi:hypothetical protein